MSTLTSYAEAVSAYRTNLNYDEELSPTKAAAFRSALRYLLLERPQSTERNGFSVSYESLQESLKSVEAWLVVNPLPGTPGRSSVRYADFSNFRGEF